MNIQDEMQKIHHKFGVSEMANYKIEQFIEDLIKKDRAEQLTLTDVVEPKGTCCLNLKKVGKVNDMFESWDECEKCGKEIV